MQTFFVIPKDGPDHITGGEFYLYVWVRGVEMPVSKNMRLTQAHVPRPVVGWPHRACMHDRGEEGTQGRVRWPPGRAVAMISPFFRFGRSSVRQMLYYTITS